MKTIFLIVFIARFGFSSDANPPKHQYKLLARFTNIENCLPSSPEVFHKKFIGHLYIVNNVMKHESMAIAVHRKSIGPNRPWVIQIAAGGKMLTEGTSPRSDNEFELPVFFSEKNNAVYIQTKWAYAQADLHSLKDSVYEVLPFDAHLCRDIFLDNEASFYSYENLEKYLGKEKMRMLEKAINNDLISPFTYSRNGVRQNPYSFYVLNNFILAIEHGYSDTWRLFKLAH